MSDLLYGEVENDLRASVRDLLTDRSPWTSVLTRVETDKPYDLELWRTLAAEIAQRKKATNERSIKLTVVLLASRRMLDDSALDPRLTYIRRQSGLDSRAALFVLSPVSQSELNDFVQRSVRLRFQV